MPRKPLTTSEELKNEADHARRLAETVPLGHYANERLLDYARELEARARDVDSTSGR